MRYAIAAVALAGAALADYPVEYPTTYDPTYEASTSTDSPIYPATSTDAPVYPTYDPTTYPTEYPTEYPTSVSTDSPESPCETSTEYPIYTTSTVYATKVYTVSTEDSIYEVTKTEAAYTTVCPVEEAYPTTEAEYPTEYATEYPTETEEAYPTDYPASSPYASQAYEAEETYPAACPTYSVKTISTSVTTVIPTVIYETVEVPCATYAPIQSAYPTSECSGYNCTKPYPVVTAGASNMGVSALFAAVAGLAALALA